MAIVPSHFPVTEEVVRYQALTTLANIATEISDARRLTSPEIMKLRAQGKQILVWLQALDAGDYLSQTQRDQLKYSLVDIADVFDFGTAPVLANVARPSILIGSGGSTITTTITSTESTAFINADIDIGTEDADTFSYALSSGAVWFYTIRNAAGTAQRSGIVTASWLSDGSAIDCGEESTPDVGTATSDVTLSVDINGGNVRLRATTLSNNWHITGKRFLIYD